MQQVTDWLNGPRDYEAGRLLYDRFGSSEFWKKLLAARVDDGNIRKLAELLAGMVPEESQESRVKSQEKVVEKTIDHSPLTIDKKRDNDRYLGLLKRKGLLYTELNILMAKRLFLPEGEELRLCAMDILNTNQKLMECWASIDHFQDHNCFPEVKGERLKVKGMEPGKEKQYLRQSISKCKARLESAGCRDREATQKLLDERVARLAELSPKKKKAA